MDILNKTDEEFDKLVDSLPNRVNETPRNVVKQFIRQAQIKAIKIVLGKIKIEKRKWVEENERLIGYNYAVDELEHKISKILKELK